MPRRHELWEASSLGLILVAYLLLLMGIRRLDGLAGFYLGALAPSLWLLGATLLGRRRRLALGGGPRAATMAWLCGAACGVLVLFAVFSFPAAARVGGIHDTVARLALVLLVPVAEELYFRGALLEHLVRTTGRAPAVLLTSALFGFLHLPQGLVVGGVMLALAVGLCLVALRGRSVLWAVALHLVWNALAVVRGLPHDLERVVVVGAAVAGVVLVIVVGLRPSREPDLVVEGDHADVPSSI
jgi:membrane protease YdiL (CAAX protease family)